jgi:hypothetical protein
VPRIARASASQHPRGRIRRPTAASRGVLVLDLIFVVATLALFGLVALIAKAVEKS